jgi:hypothetical protein
MHAFSIRQDLTYLKVQHDQASVLKGAGLRELLAQWVKIVDI